MRPETLRALCERNGDSVPVVKSSYGTWADFQDLYTAARRALRSPDDLVRLVDEVVEDAAADGVVWIEPAVNLSEHAAVGDPDTVLDLLAEAGSRAGERNGVGVGWLVSADRTHDVDVAMSQAHAAARFAGRGAVAFGLVNDESAGAPAAFAPAFDVARAAGLLSTPHAGEHGGADSVREALDTLGPTRIGHGVRAVEDPVLVRRLAAEGVCLDVCPTSNVALSVVADMDAHPLSALIAAGVPCSVNADDPLIFDVGVLDEYVTCRHSLGLDDETLAGCARSSITHSAAPHALKAQALGAVDAWLEH